MVRVMTCGTFDLFHIGHLRLLEGCSRLYEEVYLIVGVSSDEFNFSKKGKYPVIPLSERIKIIQSLSFVSEVFVEESMEKKEEYVSSFRVDVFVMGDDWRGKFDFLKCEVKYLPRTEGISTTSLIKRVQTLFAPKKKSVLTFGKFDILHCGHIYLFNECKKYGDKLIVGILPNDNKTLFERDIRYARVDALKTVDETFDLNSIEELPRIVADKNISVIVMGDSNRYISSDTLSVTSTRFGGEISHDFSKGEIILPQSVEYIQICQSSTTKESIIRKISNKSYIGKYFPLPFDKCFSSVHCNSMLQKLFFGLCQIFNKYGVKYTLSGGSLVGLIRHSGIVPWDDDGDVMYETVDEVTWEKIRTELFNDFRIISPHTPNGKIGFSGFGHANFGKQISQCSVDFFVLDGEEGDFIYSKCFPKQKFKKSSFRELQTYDFNGISVKSIPHRDAVEHLNVCFPGWNEKIESHTHTLFGSELSYSNIIPKCLLSYPKLEEKVVPYAPTNVFISSSVKQNFKLTTSYISERMRVGEFSSLPELIRDFPYFEKCIILLSKSDLLNNFKWEIESLISVRGRYSFTQIWVLSNEPIEDREISPGESGDIFFVDSDEKGVEYLKMSPYKIFSCSTTFSTDFFTM